MSEAGSAGAVAEAPAKLLAPPTTLRVEGLPHPIKTTENLKAAESREATINRQIVEIDTIATTPYRRGMKAIEMDAKAFRDNPMLNDASRQEAIAEHVKGDPVKEAILKQYAIERSTITNPFTLGAKVEVTDTNTGLAVFVDKVTGSTPDSLICTFTNADGTPALDPTGAPLMMPVTRDIISAAHTETVYKRLLEDPQTPPEQKHIIHIQQELAMIRKTHVGESEDAIKAAELTFMTGPLQTMQESDGITFKDFDSLIEASAISMGITTHTDLEAFIEHSAEREVANIDPEDAKKEDTKIAILLKRDARLAELAKKEGVLAEPKTITDILAEATGQSRHDQVDLYSKTLAKLQIDYAKASKSAPDSAKVILDQIKSIQVELKAFKEITDALDTTGDLNSALLEGFTRIAAGESSLTEAQMVSQALHSGEVEKIFDAMALIDRNKLGNDVDAKRKHDEAVEHKKQMLKTAGIGSAAILAALLMGLFTSMKRRQQ